MLIHQVGYRRGRSDRLRIDASTIHLRIHHLAVSHLLGSHAHKGPRLDLF
jgi:hypothetical protein